MNVKSKRKAEVTPSTYQVAFDKQNSVPKAEVMKLKPGTMIELKWTDAENTVALVLEKPDRCPGDVSIRVLTQDLEMTYHPTHRQVVRIIGPMVWPKV